VAEAYPCPLSCRLSWSWWSWRLENGSTQVAVLRRRVEELEDKMGTVMSREDLIGMVLLLLAVIVACTLLEMLIIPLNGPG
jgi:hypothetical protein